MDRSKAVARARQFTDRAKATLPVRQVILFGSYVHGSPHEFSDIDVAVIVEARVEDWLSASAQLFRLRRGLDLAIEPVLIDSEDDPSGFLEEIRRTGEIIYDRDAEQAAA
jgi:predicted nucleotidyltransferase